MVTAVECCQRLCRVVCRNCYPPPGQRGRRRGEGSPCQGVAGLRHTGQQLSLHQVQGVAQPLTGPRQGGQGAGKAGGRPHLAMCGGAIGKIRLPLLSPGLHWGPGGPHHLLAPRLEINKGLEMRSRDDSCLLYPTCLNCIYLVSHGRAGTGGGGEERGRGTLPEGT